jgi:hypothetical protein
VRASSSRSPAAARSPEPGSPEAVSIARAVREAHPDVPTICASVYPKEGMPDDFRSTPHLLKPVPLTELDRALRSALNP